MSRAKDITSQRFGRVTALVREGTDKGGQARWKCLCDCGTHFTVAGASLRCGNTKSCGCFQREVATKNVANGTAKAVAAWSVPDPTLRSLVCRYKQTAAKRGYTWNLTKEQVQETTQQRCHYCYKEPSQVVIHKHGRIHYIYNGIDRKNNSVGYEPENCLPCCKRCNFGKGKFYTYDEWRRMTQCFRDDVDNILEGQEP